MKNWQFGISSPPFLPLPHYLSYLTRLNNFGTGARFLYANEAAIHDLVRFHPPVIFSVCLGRMDYWSIFECQWARVSEEGANKRGK